MDKYVNDCWHTLRAKYYGEVAQKLLLLGEFRAAAVVLSWMDEEARKIDH